MYIKNPEYFITTVREGSISKAAEKLYLSQPYLSQCIARTEKELGVKLFDRSHMPLKLTEAGKIYMRYLESVGVLTGQFEEQLGELKTGRSRTLNVGMTLWRGSVLCRISCQATLKATRMSASPYVNTTLPSFPSCYRRIRSISP